MTHLNGTSDENFVMDATAFAACPSTNPCLVYLNMFPRLAADTILIGPHHASAEFVENADEGLSEKWTITPVGGSSKVPTFVSMLAPQQGLNVAVLVDFQSRDKQAIEALYKKKLLQKKNVHTYADFTGTAEADVEDMFERGFYIDLVNAEYGKQLVSNITIGKLNAKQPRIVKALETHFAATPLKSGEFSHFRPARYFTENLQVLTPKLTNKTKDRFEAAFTKLNNLL